MCDKIWLLNDTIDWDIYLAGSRTVDESLWKRSYQFWNHAKNLIENAQNDFQLGDGITNLKRSLDRRLKLIEKLYSFRSIDPKYNNVGYLEILQEYDIVRPYIMKNLLRVRNDIEHNDATPPGITRCKELIDVVWYFLKSTDLIVRYVREDFDFEMLDNEGNRTNYTYSLSVDYNPNINITIHGFLPEEVIFYHKRENTALVEIDHFGKKGLEKYNKGIKCDMHVFGRIKYELPIKKTVLKRFFSSIN